MIVWLLSQDLPEYRDVPGEPSLFHTRVTPDLLEQFVFRDHPFPILDEGKKRLQNFWSQRYRFAVAQQESLAGIQRKRSELVGGLRLLVHGRQDKSEEKRRPVVRTRNTRCS